MTKKEKTESKYIGKEYWVFLPAFMFDNCYFNYKHFKIIKEFKKSFRVKMIDSYGSSCGDLISKENFGNNFFASEEKGIVWNKKIISNTLKSERKELQKYTKLHDRYRELNDTIYILTEYLKLMDDFSLDNLKKTDEKIKEYFLKRCVFKVGEKVRTPDRGMGVINHISTFLSKSD